MSEPLVGVEDISSGEGRGRGGGREKSRDDLSSRAVGDMLPLVIVAIVLGCSLALDRAVWGPQWSLQ